MTPKELDLAADMLSDYADKLSNASCNDWEWPEEWTQEEAKDFAARLWSWFTDDGSAFPERDGWPVLSDSWVAGYLADLLGQAATEGA
ncbi:MAG: hypothetical protein JO093_13480 [Acidobacteria bacterium]|nr:hypothetical protein [Acidobacteriota bacterium]